MTQREKIQASSGPQAQLTEAIDNIAQGIVLYDADERFVVCNARYRQFRRDIEEFLVPGASFEDILRTSVARRIGIYADVEESDAETWIQKRLARFRDPGPPELRHYTDGRWESVECRATRDGGRIIIRTDVSERKSAEEQILASHADLERRVQERTRELQNEIDERTRVEHELRQTLGSLEAEMAKRERLEEKLRQAQKMEAVGQLTGGIAHDFNNLLTVVLGNAEMLTGNLAGDEAKQRAIVRAAARGAELTRNLLAFSRTQALSPQAIDLRELTGGMSDLLQRSLGESIEIETSWEPGLWTAEADPRLLENALLNLAINARDAMPAGGKLTIRCRNISFDETAAANNPEIVAGDYVALAVTDTGTGMDAETKAHAFEPFYTTKEVGKGSGLGLSMVYGFAKQSGGYVELSSTPGTGTSVDLYLPRTTQPLAEPKGEMDDVAPAGRGETVLVIEDDEEVRELTLFMLEDMGYRVLGAADADAARRILAAGESIDLVLSDVILPGGINGPEFAREARSRRPGLPVIFMSGYSDEAAKGAGLLEAGNVLLNKPFRHRQLAKAVREALA